MICCSLYQKRDPKPQKSDMHGGDPSAVKEYLQNRRRRKRHRDSLPFQKACSLPSRLSRAPLLTDVCNQLLQVLAEVPKHPDHRLEFARLGIQPHSAEALEHNSFDTPTQPQRSAIPAFLSGQHCTLMAETGSGKTLAYALPSFTEVALSRADKSKTPGYCCPSVVVVVPTQELATQTGHFVNFAAQVCTPENCKREYFVHVLAGKEKKLLKPLERRRQKAKSRSDGKNTSKYDLHLLYVLVITNALKNRSAQTVNHAGRRSSLGRHLSTSGSLRQLTVSWALLSVCYRSFVAAS
jgi:hypothetical protein